ncbi:MAG: flavodoxin domain-containing protein [Proteobacteria bacterium]|nr:flavodoxin domain-containing protein [Pseudomonadota bacterium]
MKLTIIVGTMTGTAQLVAQELELVWDGDGVEVQTLLMDNLDASVFAREGIFLVCTSTYGQGDVPDNAKKLYDDLLAKRPDLSQVRYGVFGLGDRTYAETFNFGGMKFDTLLAELGAQRIGERVQHDASSGVLPEEKAEEWAAGWLEQAREAAAQTA